MRFSPPQPDSRILVMGAGIIGNLWSCVLRHYGCRNVTITEPLADRREIASKLSKGPFTLRTYTAQHHKHFSKSAKSMGYTVLSPDEMASSLPPTAKECELVGVDLVVDCTGSAEAFESAVRWTKRGGTVLVFGCTPPGHRATYVNTVWITFWDLLIVCTGSAGIRTST